jgi:hypothetical protein
MHRMPHDPVRDALRDALEAEARRTEPLLEAEFGRSRCTCTYGTITDEGEERTTPPDGCPVHGHEDWPPQAE